MLISIIGVFGALVGAFGALALGLVVLGAPLDEPGVVLVVALCTWSALYSRSTLRSPSCTWSTWNSR